MQSFQLKPSLRRGARAFTLVEMLIVIAIISILMTAGSIGLSGMGGKGVTSGVATAESLFDEARTTAVGRNLRSCVLVAKSMIQNQSEDLRRIVVAYEEVDTTGTPTTNPNYGQAKNPNSANPRWVISNRGAILPEQTYFSSEFSVKNHKNGSGKLDTINHSSFVSPKKAYEGVYYIYRFNNQGILMDPGDTDYRGGASFIIGTGARKPVKNELPKVTGSAKRDFGGFVIWRNGRTSVFRSPEQMGSGIKGISPGGKF